MRVYISDLVRDADNVDNVKKNLIVLVIVY